MSNAAKSISSYSVHPGVAMVQKWMKELPEKTGRSLEEWLALTQRFGPPTEKERREWLKKEHKLGTNSAVWIAERLEGKSTEEDSPEVYLKTAAEWVEAQYAGARAGLRPLYEQLLKLAWGWPRMSKRVRSRPWCRSTAITYSRTSSRRRTRALISDSHSET